MSEESTSRYASTIHCVSLTVAPIERCSTGMAMLTTVPSMNAMQEPRMAAASVQLRLRFELTVPLTMFSLPRTDSFYRGRWPDSDGAWSVHRDDPRATPGQPGPLRILCRGHDGRPMPRRTAERSGGHRPAR